MSSSSEMKNALENFLIPLEEIKSATNDFHEDNYLGGGGFGKVYKGMLSERFPIRTVAIKRLDLAGGQGKHEFMNELSLLTSCHHENIIAFIGYCDEGAEMVIVYEYAARKSLDHYLRNANKMCSITWEQRLRICVGSARGLNHLHWGLGDNHRVIHRDIKGGNILLDDKWVAKVSDFGLSKFSPKNQLMTQLKTTIAGTPGYCDPEYLESGVLRKESDVYSFGVVLFEVLCGRLVFPKNFKEYDDGDDSQMLVVLTRRHKDCLHRIIDPCIRDEIDSKSLEMFTGIAYQCLQRKYKKRPTMTEILEKLEEALSIQENSVLVKWKKLLPHDYQEIIKRLDPHVAFRNKGELDSLLSVGTLIDGGKKWFSINKTIKKGHLMISAMELFDKDDPNIIGWESLPGTRFSNVASFQRGSKWGDYVHEKPMHVIAPMLSLESGYAVFLICKYTGGDEKAHNQSLPPNIYFNFYYGKETMRVKSAGWKDEGWIEMELFQFTNHMEVVNFELHLCWENVSHGYGLYVEGIEFWPIENENSVLVKWMKLLPHDYQEIIQRLDPHVAFRNKGELDSLLFAGTLIDGGKKWFSINKTIKKGHLMISSMELFDEDDQNIIGWESFPSTRFSNVASFQRGSKWGDYVHEKPMHVIAPMLSLESGYAVFLICKYTGGDEEAHNQSLPPNIYFNFYYGKKTMRVNSAGWKDEGWIEMELFQFTNHMEVANFELHLWWENVSHAYGLYVEGIEFRPIEKAYAYLEKLLPPNYIEIMRMSDAPMLYSNKLELYSLLSTGVLIDGGKKKMYVSELNKKNSIVISVKELFDENDECLIGWESFPNSRFSHVACFENAYHGYVHEKAMHVSAAMLSLESTYAVFLICKYTGKEHKAHTKSSPPDICFKLLYGENIIYPSSAEWKDEEWMEVELFMFTNHMKDAKFEIHLKWIDHCDYGLYVEGIEFRSIEMATNEDDEFKVEQLWELELDTDWERKLPSDYEEVISRSTKVLEFSTKEELYALLLRGILIDDNSMLFRLDASSGNKCVLLSTKCLTIKHIGGKLEEKSTYKRSKPWPSRFSTIVEVEHFSKVEIVVKIKAHMLSPNTPYAAWLVYDEAWYSGLDIASLTLGNQEKKTRRVHLDYSSKTIRPMNDPKYQKDLHIGTGSMKLDRRRRKRDEDWYEVELFPFFNDMDAHDEIKVGLHINPTSTYNLFYLEGIEFRPQ